MIHSSNQPVVSITTESPPLCSSRAKIIQFLVLLIGITGFTIGSRRFINKWGNSSSTQSTPEIENVKPTSNMTSYGIKGIENDTGTKSDNIEVSATITSEHGHNTTTAATQIPGIPSWKKTVIMVYRYEKTGYLHIRGRAQCLSKKCRNLSDVICKPSSSRCAIPVKIVKLPKVKKRFHDSKLLSWRGSDRIYMILSPTDRFKARFGEDHARLPYIWRVELIMDCSKTNGGYFDFKAAGEKRLKGDSTCGGSVGGFHKQHVGNHVGRCGYTNTVKYCNTECYIDHNM